MLVGDASYSLYLFHPYILQIFDKAFKSFEARTVVTYALAVVAVSLCCLASLLSYKYIEHPVTEWFRRRFIGEGITSRGQSALSLDHAGLDRLHA